MRPEITWACPSMQPALAAALIGGLAVVSVDAVRVGHPSVFGVVRVAAEGVALGLCMLGHRLLTPHSPTLSPPGRGGSLVVPPGLFAAAAVALARPAASVNPAPGAVLTVAA